MSVFGGVTAGGYPNVLPIIGDRRGYEEVPQNAPATVRRWSCMVPRKFGAAHVQLQLRPHQLWPGAEMMEKILWFTIGVLLGLIVFAYDGSTILS